MVEGLDEVLGVLLSNIFNTKVVYYKGELNWPSDLLPQAGCVGNLVVSMGLQFFCEVSIGQGSCLEKPIN